MQSRVKGAGPKNSRAHLAHQRRVPATSDAAELSCLLLLGQGELARVCGVGTVSVQSRAERLREHSRSLSAGGSVTVHISGRQIRLCAQTRLKSCLLQYYTDECSTSSLRKKRWQKQALYSLPLRTDFVIILSNCILENA